MDNLTRGVLLEILQDDWIWTKPTRKNPEPELRYHAIKEAVEDYKESKYYHEVFFPTYHRFVRKLKLFMDDSDPEVHFEEVDGEFFFGSECFHCQLKVDGKIDRILTRYVDEHPEWMAAQPVTDSEIDSLVESKPTYQPALFD